MAALLTGCAAPVTAEDGAQPDLETCTQLRFQDNVVVDDRDVVMDQLFDCFGVDATGGAAFNVAFDENGDVACVGTHAQSVVPLERVDGVIACQRAVLEDITADTCPDCGVRAVGFLFCLNAAGDDACGPFMEDTAQATDPGARDSLIGS